MLKKIIVKLIDKYSLGLCPLHHNFPYFYYYAADLHFNLNHSQLLVWAHAIKSEMATYEKIPILFSMFKIGQALKHMSKSSTDSPTPLTMPSTMELFMFVSTQVQMPVIPFPTFFQYL